MGSWFSVDQDVPTYHPTTNPTKSPTPPTHKPTRAPTRFYESRVSDKCHEADADQLVGDEDYKLTMDKSVVEVSDAQWVFRRKFDCVANEMDTVGTLKLPVNDK